MRILVVEDDEVAAEYVRKGLMEAGHVVDLAPDGDLGLELSLIHISEPTRPY